VYSRGLMLAKEVSSDGGWCAMSVAADQPVLVVVGLEGLECLVELIESGEGLDPEKLLLQGAPEPLDAAVALRGSDEGGAGFHPQEPKLGLEGAGDELAAVVMAELQSCGDGFSNAAEGHPGGLLEGGEVRRTMLKIMEQEGITLWQSYRKLIGRALQEDGSYRLSRSAGVPCHKRRS